MPRRIPLELTPDCLINAYAQGIFPMDVGGTLQWFRPYRRTIIPLDGFHTSRSLAKRIRRGWFEVRVDTDFEGVMRACADRPETWITEEIIRAYCQLHEMGWAHSVETWREGKLVGGTYGVSIHGLFAAESMFHRETDASKVAVAALVARLRERQFAVLDVQMMTEHLRSLGAIEVSDDEYQDMIMRAIWVPRSFV